MQGTYTIWLIGIRCVPFFNGWFNIRKSKLIQLEFLEQILMTLLCVEESVMEVCGGL